MDNKFDALTINRYANEIYTKFMDKFGKDEEDFIDVFDFVKKLGGSIQKVSGGDGLIEEMKIEKLGDRFSIKIPDYTSQNRDRFTVAHELGHYFMHYISDNRRTKVFRRTSYAQGGLKEWQANMFAGALLMPQDKFVEKYLKYEGNIEKLSQDFHVSIDAARVRANVLKDLNILNK
jgi:hypothetical protein